MTNPIAVHWKRSCALLLLPTLLALGCSRGVSESPAGAGAALLVGRAVLPADTFTSAARPVGAALAPRINGRDLPFPSVPVQGFSSLVLLDGFECLALQDNGFGTMANSPDYPLRWYHLRIHPLDPGPEGGPVEVLGNVDWADPDRRLPFAITRPDSGRFLYGADLDPESFCLMDDGAIWVGEEFGPSLLLIGSDGVVLEKPVQVPVVPPLRDFARGSPVLRTPDHPDLRRLRKEESRLELANLPRSGGLEGLARSRDGKILYASVEKPLLDDPERNRRVILEFEPARHGFTGNFWFYPADGEDVSVASLEAVADRVLLVLERDAGEGKEAKIKRIYRVDLDDRDRRGYLTKTLVADLMDIADTGGLTRKERGAVGLGPRYSFPYVTPECLVVVDDRTVLVANDNNYPMSAGRRPPDTPDDNEFILLRLERSLTDWN
jgi:glycerophosphoryl diester phosphodiesterase